MHCVKCENPLPWEAFSRADLSPCPSCGALVRVDIFPALFREPDQGRRGETLSADQGASCFYHHNKKAVIPCESCGRFLCALCDVELNDRHICPSCLESGKTQRKITHLENNRVLYDTIVLALAVIPLLMIWPTILTAPATLFLAIRYWNTPTSILPRTKFRFISAISLAGLQIVGWIMIIGFMVTRTRGA